MLKDVQLLLACLAVTTLLGVVIGYCVARIHARGQQRRLIESWRVERQRADDAHEQERDGARRAVAAERKFAASAREHSALATARHDAMETHAQLQAQRLSTLENEVMAAEEQLMRIQRDFAQFKSNKMRELNLLRQPVGLPAPMIDSLKQNRLGSDNLQRSMSGQSSGPSTGPSSLTDKLPVLNKRVDNGRASPSLPSPGSFTSTIPGSSATHPLANRTSDMSTSTTRQELIPAGQSVSNTRRGDVPAPLNRYAGLSMQVARELDIPALAESELPDSVDDLDFELALVDDHGAATGG